MKLGYPLCLIFILLMFGKPENLPAQQDTTLQKPDTLFYQTDDVVVTATRVEQKIIDIPFPVIRLKNTNYRFDSKISVDDVLGYVPGLFLQNRYGNHDVRISIRGFGSRSNTGIRGVRILLDGIPESEPDGQTRIEAIDFNSVGSIELVKGNSSSLYTNAPGGVINFINDINFPYSFATTFNEFGSFELRRNGFKTGFRTEKYGFLSTYSYHNYKGYREHSEDYWHILNMVLETLPGDKSNLQILGYFVAGLIKLPGSLNKEEFDDDPFQAAQKEVNFDYKRITRKGRLGLRFNTKFGPADQHEIELTAYGTIKYFHRTSTVYRIINRYGLGSSFRYIYRTELPGSRKNEFSLGGDLLYQTGPIEFYDNINGMKSDILNGLTDETIGNNGFYFSNMTEIIDEKLSLLLTGRYDNVYFDARNQLLASQNDFKRYEAFTPKAALSFKLTKSIAVYGSYGLSFDSPAGNELDNYPTSSKPGGLLNPDLKAQKSNNLEIGVKGSILRPKENFLSSVNFETTFFNYIIEDEIVPFEVFGDVYFRNSAKTNRLGLEIGVDANIIRQIGLQVSYTMSDFSYDEYNALTTEIDSTGNIVTNLKDFSGNIVPSVPKHHIYLALSFSEEIVKGITGFLRGSFRHVSGMYVDDVNSDKTSDYNLLNATAGLDMLFGRFNILISGGVNNILDKTYVGFININSASGRFYEAGEPRNFYGSVNLGYNF
ncbi:MAG: TonB-dependent receptor PqqU [Ignavibacteriaceae bacterium]